MKDADKLYSELMDKKYSKTPLKKLIALAMGVFHPYIRERDKELGCISCPTGKAEQAGHFLSAGQHPALRFNPLNVNGQCVQCNYYKHGNLINYRIGLIKRIGEDEVKKLEDLAAYYKRNGYKWQREFLIETILKYK